LPQEKTLPPVKKKLKPSLEAVLGQMGFGPKWNYLPAWRTVRELRQATLYPPIYLEYKRSAILNGYRINYIDRFQEIALEWKKIHWLSL